ncbi:MAG: DUF1449 family protein [Deltaproteobacteria bacterium]|nr:DUF1449 family protein [Deltaproteobacteria bacterium]
MSFFNHWWNLPYLIMLGLVAAFFLLQIIGLIGDAGDHDVDHDHDVDAGGGDADADADADADHGGGGHAGMSEVLAFFGIGRVPFMVVWVTLFLFTGFVGLFTNRVVYANRGGLGAGAFLLVLLGALLIGLVAVRLFARLAAKLVDVGGKGSTSKHELAGKQGVVASATLDTSFGEVRVHDGTSEQIVHARLGKGEAVLSRGARVVLIEYDAEKGYFWVTVSPEVGDTAVGTGS